MRHFLSVVLLALGVLLSTSTLESCSSGARSVKDYPVYPGLEVELSSTGGAAGFTTAHLLTGEGYVYQWRAMIRPDSLGEPLGRAEPALMDSMGALVSTPGLLSDGMEATGNMVRTLRVRRGDEVQRWSWVAGLPGGGTPEAIRPIADLLREIIRRAESSK